MSDRSLEFSIDFNGKFITLSLKYLGTIGPFYGATDTRFQIYGDVCAEFQSQVAYVLPHIYLLVRHLLAVEPPLLTYYFK